MKEREIDLLDIIVEILLKWRVIVIVMFVGAILMGGVSYLNSVRIANAQKEQKAQLEAKIQKMVDEKQESLEDEEIAEKQWLDANKQWLEEQLTEKQIMNVETAIAYEQRYEDKLIYAETSDFMKMDPYNVPTAEVIFLVSSNDMERTYNIEKAYEDVLTSTAMYEYVKEKCGVSDEIIELISLEHSSYDYDGGQDTIHFTFRHSNEEICKSMAEAMIDYAEIQEKELRENLGNHEIMVLSQSFDTLMNTAVISNQRNCKTELINMKTDAVNMRNAFTEEEWRYYNYLTQGKAIANSNPDTEMEEGGATEGEILEQGKIEVITPSVSVKYVILGMVLFAFIYVFMIFMVYILNNRIRITDNLQNIYSIPQLGIVSKEQKEKKFLGIIDEWILKLRYRNQRRFTAEEATNLAAAAAKIAVKKQGINKVCLLGCNLADNALNTCEQIKGRLSAEGTEVQILSNVLYNADTMEELADAQGAVLVETVGSTLYEEIVKELELLNRQNITVLGGIVVE